MTHTVPNPHHAPTSRILLVGAVTTAVAAVLWLVPGAGLPPSSIAGVLDWWSAAGTPAATIAVIRVIALAAAGWMLCLSVLAVMVSHTRSMIAASAWRRLAPVSLRRLIASSVIAAVATTPSIASAADHDEPPPPALTDLGPAEADPVGGMSPGTDALPVLIDLGPAPTLTEAPPAEPATAATAPVARWTVAAGDHLWRVAQETLVDRGLHPSTDDVARYWRRLIDDNQDLIGDDPDLIQPGMVLLLPD